MEGSELIAINGEELKAPGRAAVMVMIETAPRPLRLRFRIALGIAPSPSPPPAIFSAPDVSDASPAGVISV